MSTPGVDAGRRFRYSNIGYWLLGLVEAASERPFVTYVADEILAPLGLTRSQLVFAIPDAARHASGYLGRYSMLNLVKRLVIDRPYIDRYDGA